MDAPKFKTGDDLFVREPSRFIENVTCIVGPVEAVSQLDDGHWAYTIRANIGRMGGYDNPPEGQAMRFAECDLGLRGGTPLSTLSGRPGRPGYDEFKRIAASWGYD